MVQKNEEVNYQGRRGRVTNVLGDEPNQAVSIKFDDGSERVVMQNELENSGGSGERGKELNEKQIGRGQSGGGSIVPPHAAQMPSQKPQQQSQSSSSQSQYSDTDVTQREEQTPRTEEFKDSGPGTGDSAEGLKADGKDVDSTNRRLLGLEELITQIEPVTRKIVDRNGRKLEVGTTVSLKARLIKFHGADKVEIAYPPYVPTSQVPVWSDERKRLEMANEEQKPSGAVYEGMQYQYKDGKVVDANGNEVKQEEQPIKQQKLQVESRFVEKF
jgi:hypothetical protein